LETVKPLLEADEKILWQGECDPQAIKDSFKTEIVAGWCTFFLVIFALFFGALFFWGGGPLIFILWFAINLFFFYLVIDKVLIGIYRGRFFGEIYYYLTNKRIYIISKGWKILNKIDNKNKGEKVKYKVFCWDNGCYLDMNVFDFDGNIAMIDLDKIRKCQIRFGNNVYNIYFNYDEKNTWNFKLAGLKEIESILRCLTQELEFKRDFSKVQIETYIKKAI
jgi:hypothetical protein